MPLYSDEEIKEIAEVFVEKIFGELTPSQMMNLSADELLIKVIPFTTAIEDKIESLVEVKVKKILEENKVELKSKWWLTSSVEE